MRPTTLFGLMLCLVLPAGPALAAPATQDRGSSQAQLQTVADGDETPAEAPAGPYDDFVPDPSDPPDTTGETPPDTELVKRLFALAFAEQCSWGLQGFVGSRDPDIYDLTFRNAYDDDDAPAQPMRIYRFDCDAGAYNLVSVWMEWEGTWGLRPLSFAAPSYTVKYQNDDFDGKVESLTLDGMTSYNTLTNSWFDEDTRTIHSFSKWRGIADAFDSGAWQLVGSDFVLKSFDVDASYDGKADAQRLVAYPGALPLGPMRPGADGDEAEDDESEGSGG